MTLLKDEFQVLSVTDLARQATAGRLRRPSVAITFDDGLLSHLTCASKILLELGFPATFFVNTDRLDEDHEAWWDTLERIFLWEKDLPPTFRATDTLLGTSSLAERRLAYETLHAKLCRLPLLGREAFFAEILRWAGRALPPRDSHRLLRASEVLALAQRPGHEIGVHTEHHLWLPDHSLSVQRGEIVASKAVLDRLLGRPTKIFSYPFGAFSEVTVELVKEAGFAQAVTVQDGKVDSTSDPYTLPRWEVRSTDPFRDQLHRMLGPKTIQHAR